MEKDKTPGSRGNIDALPKGPRIILVQPQLGENIGAAARAMLNFGLSDMSIVDPRDGWPNERAIAMASGARAVLDGASVHSMLDDALIEQNYVLATTARPRELLLPVLSPKAAIEQIKDRLLDGQNCSILFGAERRGLENADLLKTDGIISIPVNPAFPSLNLAQAVLVCGYEWALAAGRKPTESDLERVPPASKADFDRLIEHLTEKLDEAQYFYPPEKKPAKLRNLTVALARAQLTEGEVRTLRGVIKALAQ
ncbi:MAG: RNA methyltransferase [Pseudomonadota bacterium]